MVPGNTTTPLLIQYASGIFIFLGHPPPSSTLFPYTTLFRSSSSASRSHVLRDMRCDVLINLWRSEEHTSELQSQSNLVCRLLLENKKRGPVGLQPLQAFSHRAPSRAWLARPTDFATYSLRLR